MFFFGDADSDYLAARDCGAHFVGILPGSNAPLPGMVPNIEWYRNFEEMVRFWVVTVCQNDSGVRKVFSKAAIRI